jgi:peptide/nickel transport system permease protein
MTSAAEPTAIFPPLPAGRPSLLRAVLGTIEGRIGVALALALGGLIGIGQAFAPPTELGAATPALGPSGAHLLGTDALGRDVLSRLLNGGNSVLLIPFLATTASLLIGGGAGLVAAYAGGWWDVATTKLFDLMLTLPPLLIVLVVIAGFGASSTVLIVTVAIVYLPQFGRVIRGATQTVVVNLYVAAAKARGERAFAIVAREIVPNTVAPVIATYALNLTYAILFVAGLSFLGLGVQPPSPDWGLMVAENRTVLAVAPLASLAPAVAITALAVSINLIADAITKHLTADEAGRGAVV